MKTPARPAAFAILRFAAVACATLRFAFADDAALARNPFWPIGYEGVRHPISAAPRFPAVVKKDAPKETPAEDGAKAAARRQKAAEQAERDKRERIRRAEEERAREAARQREEAEWNAAVKSLSFDGTFNFASSNGLLRTATINGKTYAAGDLLSVSSGAMRYTWRVKAISKDGKVKLERIKRRAPKPNPDQTKQEKK